MFLFHTLQSLSPKYEQSRSPVTQDGWKTTVQSGHWRKLWWLNEVLSEECQGRPTLSRTFSTPQSFPMNVKVDPTHISLLRRKSRTPDYSQTAFNCSLRKTATMREMQSSSVLWDLIYCPRVWIRHPLNKFIYWAALDTGQSTLQLISFLLINWSRWPNLLPFYNSQWAINSAV